MNWKHSLLSLFLVPGLAAVVAAQAPTAPEEPAAEEAAMSAEDSARFLALTKALGQLRPQTGRFPLSSGRATVAVPEELRFLDAASSRLLLEEVWGNPPGSAGDVLGMIVPADVNPLDDAYWGAVITYEDSGHVMDDDAAGIDYGDLLRQMQAETRRGNKQRAAAGYGAIELVGWATPPHYDATTKKLYWAKTLRFAGAETDTLNYNIRVLGRTGVLNVNMVAGLHQLAQIEAEAPKILGAVQFNPGHLYADYVPGSDHTAEYGIAALVAGTLAAKTGLLKAIWLALLAGKKFVIMGVVAIGAWITRLVSNRKKHTHPLDNQPAA